MLDLTKSFKLGQWSVFPDRLVIKDNEIEKHLEPKAMAMLVYLAEHAGETLSREALGSEIWRESYGSDEALSRIISILRTQLGDDTKHPSFIETIPKIGYRLIKNPVPVDEQFRSKHSFQRRTIALLMVIPALVLFLGFYFYRASPDEGSQYTVAVVPFQDLSASQNLAFLSVGLTNEIIAGLNDSPLLKIVARRSLENLQTENADTVVDFYIEGNVGVVGNRVQVYAELTSANDGLIIWSDTFESTDTNYLGIQQSLSSAIIATMNRELGVEIESPAEADVALAAYTSYLNGVFLSKLRGEEPLRASIDAFANALTVEPTYDDARVSLAHAEALLPYYSEQNEIAAFEIVDQHLSQLGDSQSAEAIAIRGFMAFRQWRWLEAEQLFQQSMRINPDIANTHVWYSQFMSAVGQIDAALAHAITAYELDSVSPVVNDRLATAYLWADRDEESRSQYSEGENLGFTRYINPSFLILLLRSNDFDSIRPLLRALHPEADLEPLIENIHLLNDPATRPRVVEATRQSVQSGNLIPRIEFGFWVVLEQWDQVAATIEKYRNNKKFIDVEFLFAREAQAFRLDPSFDEVTALLGLNEFWQVSQGPDFQP
jgi:DNA-binding winged helix-turn-helix (wHTH) protein/TolB-like protein